MTSEVGSSNPNSFSRRRYVAPALAGRIVGNLLRKQDQTDRPLRALRVADAAVSSLLLRGHMDPLPETEKARLGALFSDTSNWHGSGRYQYRDKGDQVLDLLGAIAQAGELITHYDPFDLERPTQTISTARSPMYARVYSDMHQQEGSYVDRYMPTAFWAGVFGGDIILQTIKDYHMLRRTGRQQVAEHYESVSVDQWLRKVRRSEVPTIELFSIGSDIPSNYPVVWGYTKRRIYTDRGSLKSRTTTRRPLGAATSLV